MDTQLPPDADGLSPEASTARNEGAGRTAPKRTTDVLFDTIAKVEGERISIGQLIDGLGERAYGILFMLLALPTIIPAPPGMSAVTGTPMLFFALQMVIGHPHPWLPAFLRRRSVARADLLAVLNKCAPWLRKVERITRPRLTYMVEGWMERFAGLVVLFLAGVLILPIFMGNMFPSIAVALIALAVMERDGVAVIAGYIAAVASTIVAFGFIVVTFKVMIYAVHEFLGL
ncbi:exopolysaccharide biosynthesis protein [Niveispirillum sp. KHB5.9]|uniref:exopolysaccharide biosynthesis protein n=1 Tax=Niveispirillum sp. KHB5.9 TaxID=3400269 RepID=UPI003A84DCF0